MDNSILGNATLNFNFQNFYDNTYFYIIIITPPLRLFGIIFPTT